MTSHVRDNTSDAGFSLVEVLVAFAIVSVGLAALYAGYALHFRSATEARLREDILLLAQSLMDSTTRARPAKRGVTTGTLANGTAWTMTIAPVRLDATRAAVPLSFRMEVFDQRRRRIVELVTIDVATVER